MNSLDYRDMKQRIAYLRREAEREDDQEPLRAESKAGLDTFLKRFEMPTAPSLVLSNEGNLRARWEGGIPHGSLVLSVLFLDAETMRVVSRTPDGSSTYTSRIDPLWIMAAERTASKDL